MAAHLQATRRQPDDWQDNLIKKIRAHPDLEHILLSGHYCTLHSHLWKLAIGGNATIQFLCLDCIEGRLGRRLREADFVVTLPEIIARFAGQPGKPLPPDERQRDLPSWRAYVHTRTPARLSGSRNETATNRRAADDNAIGGTTTNAKSCRAVLGF